MVVATIEVDPVKHELKSAPGGWVTVKVMSYGAKQTRQEMALSDARMRNVGTKGKQEQEIAVNMMQRIVAEFEFAQCIDDHNLTDKAGNKLDFKDPKTLDKLHGRVGEEIDKLISAINNFEDEVDGEGLTPLDGSTTD